MKYFISTFIFSFFSIISIFGQERTVKGIIVDHIGEPLIAAAVWVPNSEIGTITNIEGYFEIMVPVSTSVLQVSYVGYHTQTLYIVCDSCVHKIALNEAELSDLIYGCFLSSTPKVFTTIQEIYTGNIIVNSNINISSSLNSLTGVYTQSGALNANSMTLRGVGTRSLLNTSRTKIYYDDILINHGETFINDLDILTLDKISMIKGSFLTSNGTPLGGTIILNSEYHEHELRKGDFRSEVSIGSFGFWRNSNRLKLKLEKGDIQLFQNTVLSEGYRENNEYNRKSLGVIGNIEFNHNNKLKFIGYRNQVFGEMPSSIDKATYLTSPQSAAENWINTGSYEEYSQSVLGINHEYYGDLIEIENSLFANFRNNDEVRPSHILNEKTKSIGWRPRLEYDNSDWKYLSLVAGAELVAENYEWKTYENENLGQLGLQLSSNIEQRQYVNLYSSLIVKPINKFLLSAGINTNRTQYQLQNLFTNDTINQSIRQVNDWIYSPKIALNYFFEGSFQIFANINHGFSIPSIQEMISSNGLISSDLKPETGWNYELGSEGQFSSLDLSYQVAIYRMDIQNFIVTKQIEEDVYTSMNAGATQHNGIEATIDYRYENWNLRTNYSHNNYVFKDFTDNGNDYSGNKLAGIPSNTLNATIAYHSTVFPFYGILSYRFVDAIPILDDNSLFTESYQLLDFKGGYEYELDKLTINAYLGMNNITNEKYASMLAINGRGFNGNEPRFYYSGLPRNIYGGISIHFEI